MFNVKVLWLGTYLGDSSVEDFESFFKEDLGFKVRYEEEFKLNNGTICILFSLSDSDVPRFSMFRLTTDDMKWLDDFVDNNGDEVPEEIIDKYL